MSMDVRIKSGEQPRYFTWGGSRTTTVVAQSAPIYREAPAASFHAMMTGSGAVTATVLILGSNDPLTAEGQASNWVTLGTISLSGTNTANGGYTDSFPWRYVAASVTAITGTGAAVGCIMGV